MQRLLRIANASFDPCMEAVVKKLVQVENLLREKGTCVLEDDLFGWLQTESPNEGLCSLRGARWWWDWA